MAKYKHVLVTYKHILGTYWYILAHLHIFYLAKFCKFVFIHTHTCTYITYTDRYIPNTCTY